LARADAHGDPLPDGAVTRLGTLRFNHGERLHALFFSPNGKILISEGRGAIRLWDAATGKEQSHLPTGPLASDVEPVLSADGKTLTLFDGQNDSIHLWDLAQGKEVRRVVLPVRRRLWSIYQRNALAPDGRLAAVHTSDRVQVFDVETARELCHLPQKGDEVTAVVFAGNDLLVSADKKDLIEVREARTGTLLRRFSHGAPVGYLAASADGRLLATLELNPRMGRRLERGGVWLWDVATGTRLHTLAERPGRFLQGVRFARTRAACSCPASIRKAMP
jgi:WD40 repeat protein